jgi:hypothetical protein
MEVQRVDERDSSWEDDAPRFRVYLFDRGRCGGDYAVTDTWDITGADVLEAIRWAQDRAGRDGLYAVAVVREELKFREDEHPSRGLVWLVGMDWFDDVAEDVDGQRTKDRMIARRGQAVVAAEPP